MQVPFKCPVCEGRGSVPEYFYHPSPLGTHGSTTTGPNRETCRSCGGTGIVWSWIADPVIIPPIQQWPWPFTINIPGNLTITPPPNIGSGS